MVACPSCGLGAFLKQGIHIPYLGLVKDIFLELTVFVVAVTLLFHGFGLWETLAVFLAAHVAWSWVKSGWSFESGIEESPNQ